MNTLDDLLIEGGEVLDELAAQHTVIAVRPPRRRSRLTLAAVAAVGLAATGAVVAVATRDSSPGSVVTSDPPASDGAPATPSGPAVPSTASPEPTAGTTAAPVVTIPIDAIGPEGGPIVAASLPEGYRPVRASYSDGPMAGGWSSSSPDGWFATYVQRTGSARVPHIQVSVWNVTEGDPFAAVPWAPGTPDVRIGPFVGRVANAEPESVSIVVPLDPTHLLYVTGVDTSLAAVEELTAGLQVDLSVERARATVMPDGFELIGEGPISGADGSAVWEVAYAKDERQDSTISVRTVREPRLPTDLALIAPDTEVIDLDGRTAYARSGSITFELDSGLQITVSAGGLGGLDDADAAPRSLLVEVAANLVGATAEEFERLQAETQARPLAPVDLPCSLYVSMQPPGAAAGEHVPWTVDAPGEVTVQLSSRQPLLDVELWIATVDADGMATRVPLNARVPALDEQPVQLTFAWDATLDGAPAPSGDYAVALTARPDPERGALCSPTGIVGGSALTLTVR